MVGKRSVSLVIVISLLLLFSSQIYLIRSYLHSENVNEKNADKICSTQDSQNARNARAFETPEEVLKKHSEIILDGNTTDWLGKPPSSYNTGTISMREYIWNDTVGDDVGATKAQGGYTYPTSVPAGSLDIIEFRVCIDNTSLNFLIKFRELINAGGILNFSHQFVEILIDTNRNGSGRNDTLRNANLALDSQCAWEYAIWLDGFGNCSMIDLENTLSPVSAIGNEIENCIEVKINISYFAVLPDLYTWQYVVLSGARAESLPDAQYGSKVGFAEVNAVATATTGGGGIAAGADPNVYDILFTTIQNSLLNTYSTTPTTMLAQGMYDNGITLDGSTIEAQSFIPTTTAVINRVEIYLKRDPGAPRSIYLSIQENDDLGTQTDDDDIPSGIKISSTEVNNANPSPNNYISVLFTFTDPPLVCAGKRYWIVVEAATAGTKNAYLAYWSNPLGNNDRYVNGMRVTKTISTGSWTHHATQDFLFFISILSPSVSNASANILFAPIYFTKISSFGIGANEYVTIYYDGLGNDWLGTETADLAGWSISNFVDVLHIETFTLQNGNWGIIHVGEGTNTSSELYFWRSEMFNDSADEIMLLTPNGTIVDFVSYSDGIALPQPPPQGAYWGPETSESLPPAPNSGEYLKLLGLDNDYYSDWIIDYITTVDHLYVSADDFAIAGENFEVCIEVKDMLNNTISGYFGIAQIHAVREDGFTNTTHNLSSDSVLITNGEAYFSVSYQCAETIRIFARVGSAFGISENITIVAGSLAKISIFPPFLNISAGESAQFTAYGFDAYDNPVDLTSVTWTTDVGSIFSNGYFTASTIAPISGFVYASVGLATCASAVNVFPNVLNHLHIIPENATIVVNGSMQFSVLAHDLYNNEVDISNGSFNWSSLRGYVNSSGYYIAPTLAGLDDVIVDYAGFFAVCIINVTPGELARVEISPRVENLTAGSLVQFSACAYDMYGNLIENVGFEWSTSIGSISQYGLLSVTNQSNVTGYVRVSNGTFFDEIMVTVEKGGLARIVVYPSSWNMTTDEEKQFFAVGYDVVGNVVPAEFIWDCEGGTIDNTGLFKPDRVGQAVVRAHFWPFFGVANINVSIGKIVGIMISPIGAEITADETIQFQATGYDADLNSMPIEVNWSVCCGGIIYQNGTYEGIEAGTWTITAEYGNITKNVIITVLPGAIHEIVVYPPIYTVAIGSTVTYSAEAYDSDGNIIDTTFIWSASGGTISSSGSYFATSIGNWTVMARAGNISASALACVYYTTPPPKIYGKINDQIYPENYGSWVLNLSSNMIGNSDPTLRWYITNENSSIFYVYGENITGGKSLTFVTVPNAYGNTQVQIFLENSEGMYDTRTFWVNITHINRPPLIANLPDLSVHYDEVYSFNLTPYISDSDNKTFELTVTSSDTHVKIEKSGGNFIAVMLYPKSMLGQIVPVVFTVSDGLLSCSEVMLINISSNHPPKLNLTLPDVTMYENTTLKGVFKLSDYFYDPDSDSLYYTYGFSHIVVVINSNGSVDITAPANWFGTELVTFRAFDLANGIIEDSILVTVIPINDPPVISGVPNLVVHYDYEYFFDLSPYVSDPDNSLNELELSVIFPNYNPSYAWISPTNNLAVVFRFPESWLDFDIPVTFTISDGINESYQVIYVKVSTDYPPELLRPLESITFMEDTILYNAFNLSKYFYDRDNDALIYTYGQKNVNATIHPNGSVDFTAKSNWFGVELITFRAIDPYGALVEQSVVVTVVPVPDAPVIDALPQQKGVVGKIWVLDLERYIHDVDTEMSDIDVFVDNTNVKVAGKVLIFNFSKIGRLILNVRVFDGQLNASTTLLIIVSAPYVKTEINWIPFILLGVVAVGTTTLAVRYYLIARRKEGVPIVEEAFMVYDDGCLIAHVSKQERKEIDDDVLTGMLTAVQEFVKDSFKENDKWTLRKLEFGQKNILIERGMRIYIAVIYRGEASKELTDKMAEVVSRMEKEHSAELSNWDGKTEKLKDAKDKLNEILAIGKKEDENEKNVFLWLKKEKDIDSRRREERNRESLVFVKKNGIPVSSNSEYRNGKSNGLGGLGVTTTNTGLDNTSMENRGLDNLAHGLAGTGFTGLGKEENDVGLDKVKNDNGLDIGLEWGNDRIDNGTMKEETESDKVNLIVNQEDEKRNEKEVTKDKSVKENIKKEVNKKEQGEREQIRTQGEPAVSQRREIQKLESKTHSGVNKEEKGKKEDGKIKNKEDFTYKPRMEYIDESEDEPEEYPVDKIDSIIILEKGCYFVHGSQKYARKIFTNMLTFGAKGLLITDDPKEFLEEIAGEEVRLIWLGKNEGQVDAEDFEKIKKIILGYVKENKGATVLIENNKINEEEIEKITKYIGEIKGNITSCDAKLILFIPQGIKGKGIEEICKVAQRLDEL